MTGRELKKALAHCADELLDREIWVDTYDCGEDDTHHKVVGLTKEPILDGLESDEADNCLVIKVKV